MITGGAETQAESQSEPEALTCTSIKLPSAEPLDASTVAVVALAGREAELTNAPPVVRLRHRTSNPVSSLELSVHVTSSTRAPAAAAATLDGAVGPTHDAMSQRIAVLTACIIPGGMQERMQLA